MAFGQLRAPISIVRSISYAGSSSRILADPTGERRNRQFRQRFCGLRSCRPDPSGESGFNLVEVEKDLPGVPSNSAAWLTRLIERKVRTKNGANSLAGSGWRLRQCHSTLQRKGNRPFAKPLVPARTWLDNNKIEPIECKTTSLPDAAVAIDIHFARQGEADLFQLAFRL